MKPPQPMPQGIMAKPPQGGLGQEPAPNAPPQGSGDDGQVGPEEQAMYDQFVNTALDIIYPEQGEQKVAAAILQNLKGELDPRISQLFEGAQPPLQQNPTDSLAATGVVVTIMTQESMGNGGAQVPADIILHAGAEILEILNELAEAAGIVNMTEDDLGDTSLRAMDLFRVASPTIDQEGLTAEFQQIVEADKAGNLGSILPENVMQLADQRRARYDEPGPNDNAEAPPQQEEQQQPGAV